MKNSVAFVQAKMPFFLYNKPYYAFAFVCIEKAPLTISAPEDVKIVYYRALYPFESRSHDEITIQPGDIIMVREEYSVTQKHKCCIYPNDR